MIVWIKMFYNNIIQETLLKSSLVNYYRVIDKNVYALWIKNLIGSSDTKASCIVTVVERGKSARFFLLIFFFCRTNNYMSFFIYIDIKYKYFYNRIFFYKSEFNFLKNLCMNSIKETSWVTVKTHIIRSTNDISRDTFFIQCISYLTVLVRAKINYGK